MKKRTAKQEIGYIPVKDYQHKIPKTFFCVQCGKRHSTEENMHYYNSLCHRWSYKK